MAYNSKVYASAIPRSTYDIFAEIYSTLNLRWSYSYCQFNWFRVQSKCFIPPKVDNCPPYPKPLNYYRTCRREFLNSYILGGNTGLGIKNMEDPTSAWLPQGAIDYNTKILPSQYAVVIDQSLVGDLNPYAQYVGLAENAKAPGRTNFTFQTKFYLPTNVEPLSATVTITFKTPLQIVDILVNGISSGLSKSFGTSLLTASFSGETFNFVIENNTVDVILFNPERPPEFNVPFYVRITYDNINACINSNSSTEDPNTSGGCLSSIIDNVRACGPEDVCAILKRQGRVYPIESIRWINNDSLDPNCYIEVTPDIEGCVECCEFLVDENVKDFWTAIPFGLVVLNYSSYASAIASCNSSYNFAYNYSSFVEAELTPSSSPENSYGYFNSFANVITSGLSNGISSYYYYNSFVKAYVVSAAIPHSTHWDFESYSVAYLNADSDSYLNAILDSNISASLTASSSYSVIMNYSSVVTGYLTPLSTGGVDDILYSSLVSINAYPMTDVVISDYWNYESNILITASTKYYPILSLNSNISATVSALSEYNAPVNYYSYINVITTPQSSVVLSDYWSWSGYTKAVTSALSEYISSDLGVVSFEGFVTSFASNEGAVLLSTPVDVLPLVIGTRNVTDCCFSISNQLEFRHNLNLISDFGNFLKRNGKRIPGQINNKKNSEDFISLIYSSRSNSWIGNYFISGLFTKGSGKEDWIVSVEFGCFNKKWRFSIKLYRKNNFYDATLRFLCNFTPDQICSSPQGFSNFNFSFSPLVLQTIPGSTSVIFNDEDNMSSFGPNVFEFYIGSQPISSIITTDVDFTKQINSVGAL